MALIILDFGLSQRVSGGGAEKYPSFLYTFFFLFPSFVEFSDLSDTFSDGVPIRLVYLNTLLYRWAIIIVTMVVYEVNQRGLTS